MQGRAIQFSKLKYMFKYYVKCVHSKTIIHCVMVNLNYQLDLFKTHIGN